MTFHHHIQKSSKTNHHHHHHHQNLPSSIITKLTQLTFDISPLWPCRCDHRHVDVPPQQPGLSLGVPAASGSASAAAGGNTGRFPVLPGYPWMTIGHWTGQNGDWWWLLRILYWYVFFDVLFNWDVSNGVILYWDVFCWMEITTKSGWLQWLSNLRRWGICIPIKMSQSGDWKQQPAYSGDWLLLANV